MKNITEGITMEKPYTFNKYYGIMENEYNKTFVYAANGKPVLPIHALSGGHGYEKWALYSGVYVVIDVSSPIWLIRRASLYGEKLMGQYPKYELFVYCLKVDSKQRRVDYKVLGTYYVNNINEISKFAQCETDIMQ